MTEQELIDKILISSTALDIFTPSNWLDEYRTFTHLIHPDKCSNPKSADAFAKLSKFKDEMEYGIEFTDEVCSIRFKDNVCTFTGPKEYLELSYNNYHSILKSVTDPPHFPRYLPKSMEWNGDQLKVHLQERSILIQDLVLEEKHVKWILNRLLEFSSISNVIGGWSHVGLNPKSVLVCPEGHGIQIISFYHSRPINTKLNSIIGVHPYKSWYPTAIFASKMSTLDIDLVMCKRIAMTLLGDKSGVGTSLRGKIDDGLLSFLLTKETIQEGYVKYQEYLDKFPRIFHALNL